MSNQRKRKRTPKRVLALPDLERSKTAVLNSLTSKSGQRTYDRAITDFVVAPAMSCATVGRPTRAHIRKCFRIRWHSAGRERYAATARFAGC